MVMAMKVQNKKCIRRLSRKSLYAYRKRNLIAILAIALTTVLFTSLFTIVLSINTSFETYQFRQLGGYNHGTFKEVNEEQILAISAHKNVKETGVRNAIGTITEGVFGKTPAELSYMDENCTKWSYAEPTTGRMPKNGKEVTMDTTALALLGITPALGAEVALTYDVGDKSFDGETISDTFTLVGWWDYDDLMPVHYINISKEYMKEIEAQCIASGLVDAFRTDLNVMMASSVDIRGQMEKVDTDLGYTWEIWNQENTVRIGVNWGYTSAQLSEAFDFETLVAILAFIVLVVFTGYLIIYNIFQISVTGDIRFYGLLKTIGVTPKQLRHIIRWQALLLCLVGIPLGLLLGYGIGVALLPVIIESTIINDVSLTVSASPVIFVGSALFSLATVLFSCAKPGRIASRVSPVEATKYTGNVQVKKKRRATRGAKVHQMAFGNLGRNRSKTALVVISLALSVVLLNTLYMFVGGFSMERYLAHSACSDFIVSTTDYFRFSHNADEFISEETIRQIEANTEQTTAGCGYMLKGYVPNMYMDEDKWLADTMRFTSPSDAQTLLAKAQRKGDKFAQMAQIEGIDRALFDKLGVVEGDIAPMLDGNSRSIAIDVHVDDYGNVYDLERYPQVGETATVTYIEEIKVIDTRTGEPCNENTPAEYIDSVITKSRDVDYTVCALVTVPYSMSFRYGSQGYSAVLPVEAMQRDSGQDVTPICYLFDTPDAQAEQEAEAYLARLTSGAVSTLMYESKETLRTGFRQYQSMFLLLGGVLCAIIGLVGVLNFFNAIMTSILARLREFAVLQAVGMTNGQLKAMLVYEGLIYALGSVGISFVLTLILNPLAGGLLEDVFWFFEARFTILPVLIVIPIFALLGFLVPAALYGQTTRESVVERLRETE